MDPGHLGTLEWSEIGEMLTNLWITVLLVVLFATSMLIGHNAIPSLVASGHIQKSWQKVRVVTYSLAIIFFGLAVFFFVQVVTLAQVLRRFWADYWI
jgi:hypothetical protein